MTGKRLLLHSFFVFLLPIVVAWFGISTAGAIGLVVLALLWRWAISLSAIVAPARVPVLELETISASHFVEKVRWSMDRLGVEYVEKQVGGTLGAFFLGRTVPQLKIRTGAVRSVIGNSPQILRYLWGSYYASHGERARFLEPTLERLELEEQFDRYGVDLQVWVYWHILKDRDLTLQAWGANSAAIPAWQRYALMALFPLLRAMITRSFRIDESGYTRAVMRIESLLASTETRLADGRTTLLGGVESDFTDITFAALSGLWLQPPQFGAGMSDAVRMQPDSLPAGMAADMARWVNDYPRCVALMRRLYNEERRITPE